LVDHVRIVLSGDPGFFDDSVFSAQHWNEHIDSIMPILALNIRDCRTLPQGNLLSLMDKAHEIFFPPRALKLPEKSLVSKHFYALNNVRDLPTLILEDDAQLNEDLIDELVESVRLSKDLNCFVDLGSMPGMTSRGRQCRRINLSYTYQLIGCTRTTVASVWPPRIARLASANYWPCSLPADLHHQYLLASHNIPGIWPHSSIFTHLSSPNSGVVVSSIQD
jgi:hypothetical protein